MKNVYIKEIIEWGRSEGYSFEFYGNSDTVVNGFSSLGKYKEKTITWINLKNPIDETVVPNIHCAVIQKGVKEHPDNYFITEESKKFFFAILDRFFSNSTRNIAEKENSYIGENVSLGKNVSIGCNCVLDGDIYIGDNTIIEHNVTIVNHVSVGKECIVHSGTVIGKDGFGFSFDKDNVPRKVPHFGGVKIGNRVEIGCNCVVDRGTIDDTSIGDDTKIDSLVIIAHNCDIGEGTLIVGGTAIGGSCLIGDKSYIAPHAVIKNKTSVGCNSFIGMGVVTMQNIDDNSFVLNPTDGIKKNRNYRRFL